MRKLPVVDFDPVKLFLKELEVSRACCPFPANTLFFNRIVSQNLLYSSTISMVETTLLSYGDLTYVYPILLRYVLKLSTPLINPRGCPRVTVVVWCKICSH